MDKRSGDSPVSFRSTFRVLLRELGRTGLCVVFFLMFGLHYYHVSVGGASDDLADTKQAQVLALASRLKDAADAGDDIHYRETAAALRAVGAPAIPSLLHIVCQSNDDRLRFIVIVELGRMGRDARSAKRGLVSLTNSANATIRLASLRALAEIQPSWGRGHVSLLIQCLHDEDPLVSVEAALALSGCGKVARPAIPPLAAILRDSNADLGTRRAAAQALGRIDTNSEIALDALSTSLSDGYVRSAAMESLRRYVDQSPKFVPAIINILGSPSRGDRLDAIRLLGAVGADGADVIGPLQEMAVSDEDIEVRALAKAAIERVGRGRHNQDHHRPVQEADPE